MLENNKILELLKKQVIELDKQSVVASVKKALNNGIDAYSILATLSIGMKGVGEKFQTKEYYISDLIMAGNVMQSGVAVLEPYLKSDSTKASGIIVLGSVKGDIHDIGKNIFRTLVESSGFTRVMLMPRFLDVLLKTKWYERKLFVEAAIASEDMRVINRFNALGFPLDTNFILCGSERRCAIYDYLLREKAGISRDILAIDSTEDVDMLNVNGAIYIARTAGLI